MKCFLKDGTIDAQKETDYNQAIFALKSPTGEVAILNSGSDRKDIIDEFGTFLSQHEEVLRIFTAIRPQSIKRVCQNANII